MDALDSLLDRVAARRRPGQRAITEPLRKLSVLALHAAGCSAAQIVAFAAERFPKWLETRKAAVPTENAAKRLAAFRDTIIDPTVSRERGEKHPLLVGLGIVQSAPARFVRGKRNASALSLRARAAITRCEAVAAPSGRGRRPPRTRKTLRAPHP